MKTIQIQIDAGKQGPAPQAPTDLNSFAAVALWRGEAVNIDVALFADASTVATVTNVTEITLEISATADHAAPLVTSTATVANTRLDLSVTKADWEAGTARHATFPLAVGALAPDLAGQAQRTLWLRLTMTDDTNWVVLANGQMTVHEAGSWPS